MSLFSATKLIKKPEKLAKHDSPINDSEHTEHFQPSTSNDFTVGNYILKKHIADGTFGRVYEAMDQRNKSKFAIKVHKFHYILHILLLSLVFLNIFIIY